MDETFSCHICEDYFPTKFDLTSHVKVAHQFKMTNQQFIVPTTSSFGIPKQKYACHLCSKTYKIKMWLTNHYEQKHNLTNYTTSPPPSLTPQSWDLSICRQPFPSINQQLINNFNNQSPNIINQSIASVLSSQSEKQLPPQPTIEEYTKLILENIYNESYDKVNQSLTLRLQQPSLDNQQLLIDLFVLNSILRVFQSTKKENDHVDADKVLMRIFEKYPYDMQKIAMKYDIR